MVGHEHLLLAFLRMKEGSAYAILREWASDLDALTAEVLEMIPAKEDRWEDGDLPYASSAKTAIEAAMKAERLLNPGNPSVPNEQISIGTDCLLLGILAQENPLTRTLERWGIQHQEMLQRVEEDRRA